MDPVTTAVITSAPLDYVSLFLKAGVFGGILGGVLWGLYKLINRAMDILSTAGLGIAAAVTGGGERISAAMEKHAEAATRQASSMEVFSRDIGDMVDMVREIRAEGREQTILLNRIIIDLGTIIKGQDND